MPPTTLGQRLRAARLAADLTQVELAAAAGLAQATVCDFEAGRSQPSAYSLCRLCRALGVSADTLLGLAGKVPVGQMRRGPR